MTDDDERERSSADATLDPAAIDRLLTALGDAGPAVVSDVIATFLDESARLVTAIRQSVSGAGAAEARDPAHSLKSSAAALGATRLADACADLEVAAEAGDVAAAAGLGRRVQTAHAAAGLALQNVVATLRDGRWGTQR